MDKVIIANMFQVVIGLTVLMCYFSGKPSPVPLWYWPISLFLLFIIKYLDEIMKKENKNVY